MAALSAQLAAAHKEAAAQQELCRGATTRAASLDVKLGKAQVRGWYHAGDSLASLLCAETGRRFCFGAGTLRLLCNRSCDAGVAQ